MSVECIGFDFGQLDLWLKKRMKTKWNIEYISINECIIDRISKWVEELVNIYIIKWMNIWMFTLFNQSIELMSKRLNEWLTEYRILTNEMKTFLKR